MTRLDLRLVAAYLATDYRVGDVAIVVGRHSTRVDRLLQKHGARCGAFVSPCNPSGRMASRAFNRRRYFRFLHWARIENIAMKPGLGEGWHGDWPPEPSFILFGLNERRAAAIGRMLRQNAIVTVRRGTTARLLGARPGFFGDSRMMRAS